MPFIDHPKGHAYYRHWAAAGPRAAVIFLHGFGEHTGVYHRYGFALNAAGIDLWAVDQLGHGLSPGDRGDFGSIEDSSSSQGVKSHAPTDPPKSAAAPRAGSPSASSRCRTAPA